jgi:FkbM family methyltransferase
VFAFFEILEEDLPPIRVVDVGAAAYGKDPYAALTEQGLCEVVGFEPHADNCARRNAEALPTHRYLPYALGDGRKRRFYECQNPLTSSLYRPNVAMLQEFSNLTLPVVAEHDIETRRLDDLAEIGDMDYLKLDVQGAELDVLLGGSRLLQKALVVHTEVEFVPMYEGQPLFGDIDVALRRAGFWLHRLDGINGRALKPFAPNGDPFAPLSQLLWADAAVYVRSFTSFAALPPEKLLKLAAILHEVYDSYDLAALALRHHDAQTGRNVRERYMGRLAAP